jgi:hypothetical protein
MVKSIALATFGFTGASAEAVGAKAVAGVSSQAPRVGSSDKQTAKTGRHVFMAPEVSPQTSGDVNHYAWRCAAKFAGRIDDPRREHV